jgi:raffinose/stachyose/melibiose transport system permease protein
MKRILYRRLSLVLSLSVLVILVIICITPLFLVLINSLKTHREILSNPLSLPKMLHFENYSTTWKIINFSRAFLNSVKLTATAIVTACVAAGCMGYVLAGKKVRTWKFLTIYFMLATTVPLQLFMLPLYSMFVRLHLMGNPFALGVVIAAWDLPLPIFLMRTYFLKIPPELEEAANIDGAGTLRTFSLVMMPIVSPGLITVAVIIGLFAWNEYLLSSTLLQGDANLTASIKFMSLNGMYSANFNIVMAGAVIMIIPILIIFLALQKKFIEGMASGAVKG